MTKTLKQLYIEMRTLTFVPCTQSSAIAGAVIVTDLLVSFGLFYFGYSIAFSHFFGLVAAGFLLLLLHRTGIDRSPTALSELSITKKVLTLFIYLLVQSAIRGGSIASLVHFGLSDSLALLSGILAAYLIGSYSSSLLLTWHSRAFGWLGIGITLAACVFALRLVFLGGMEVIPQEAYYWNYAQHLSPGYLDHPPMVATTIYMGELLFGHGALGTRFGAFIYGIIFIFIFYRFARLQVDQASAVLASSFAMLFPYFFMGTGFLITPDSPLSMAWVMALYFFYQALVNDEPRAWYGVGLAMGIGMLSKYTISLLAPAALLFILIDPNARRHLLRKEPYIAVLIAILVFSPVIYWNAVNDWASFAFQASGRFQEEPHNFLWKMVTNILAMVTPLPLLALPYLFTAKVFRTSGASSEEEVSEVSPFGPRVRLFIGSFLLLPMSVFAWNALENEPRYNWTAPLWITLLPMLAWLIVNADTIRWPRIGIVLKKSTRPLLFSLIGIYAILLHFLAIGLPLVDFPRGTARLVGWPEASRNVLAIQEQLLLDAVADENDQRVIVTGMDKYFIASKLAYYGTDEIFGDGKYLQVTGSHLFGDNSLMYAYWDPAEEFAGNTVIMLSRSKPDLSDARLTRYFERLSPQVLPFPIYKKDFALPGQTIREYYYRVGFSYKPISLETGGSD